jgi:hypothetical protein
MPFGKHRGIELSAIPLNYLEWLSDLPDLREPLGRRVSEEIKRRQDKEDRQSQNFYSNVPSELREVCRQIADKGYRTVALHSHPDQGGDHESMLLLNRAIEVLRGIIG